MNHLFLFAVRRKIFGLYAIIGVLFPLFAATGFAQWTKTAGTEGGNGTTVHFQRSTRFGDALFIGMNGGGVFRSSSPNQNAQWTQVSSGLTQNGLYPTTITSQGDTLWLGTHDGIFRSVDNAASWQAVGAATFAGLQIVKIVFNGPTIFASTLVRELSTVDTVTTPSECVYRSTDNGASWQAVSTNLPKDAGERYTLCVSPSVAAGTRIYALGSEHGVYVSTDNGTTWNANNTGLTGNSLRLSVSDMLADGANLTICTRDGVFRAIRAITPTTPEGTWQPLGTGLKGQILTGIVRYNSGLAVGTEGGGVFQLNTSTSQWTPLNNTFNKSLPNFFVKGIAANNFQVSISGDDLFVVTEGAGFINYATQPADGRAWQQTNTNLIAGTVSTLFTSNGALIAGTSGNGIMRSLNSGNSWSRAGGFEVPQGPQGGSVYVNDIAQAGNRLFAATYGGVFSSTDNGSTWTSANGTGANALRDLALSVYGVGADATGTPVFAATGNGLYASSDNGATWQVRGAQSLDDSVQIHNFAFRRTGSTTTIFAGTLESGVYRSTDGGNTWREASGNLTRTSTGGLSVNAILVSGANLFAATADGVYFSSDDGRTWTRRASGMDANNPAAFRIVERNGILIATTAGGVYRSGNNGASWTNVSQGLKNTSNYALAADAENAYIADDTFGDGVWRRPLTQVITSVRETAQNSVQNNNRSLALEAAPNPASEDVLLRFTLPKTSRITVDCFDILGKVIMNVPEQEYAEGSQVLRLSVEHLPQGVMTIRLRTEQGLNSTVFMRIVR